MTPEERDELKLRWHECERQTQPAHAGRVVTDGSPAEVEATYSKCDAPLRSAQLRFSRAYLISPFD